MKQHLGAPSITPLRGFLLVHENSQVAVGGSHRRAASATGRNGPTLICATQSVGLPVDSAWRVPIAFLAYISCMEMQWA